MTSPVSKLFMPHQRIRPLAICLINHHGKTLAAEGYDPVKGEIFYRPLGGQIEFGERGHETIVREFREEIDAAVTDIKYLGALENLFTFNGEKGHEIVLVYAGNLADAALYDQENIAGVEDGDNLHFIAKWIPIADCIAGRVRLYPEGVLTLYGPNFQT